MARIAAEEVTRLQGGSAEVEAQTRLFQLDELILARRAPRFRPVVDLATFVLH